jgi:hypothetical protein
MPYGGFIPTPAPTGYDNKSPENVAYRLRTALDRDDRLNVDEKRVYEDTKCELEFGPGFLRRAHP